MNVVVKEFGELSNIELYDILKLRAEVFVVEQNCPYQDMDDKDQNSLHLMFWENDYLIAYTRLLDKGISYPEYASIGRVVTSPTIRGKGIGKKLMAESIKVCIKHFGKTAIKISAQFHLKTFYEEFGFVTTGHQYLEDNIPHIAMIKTNLE